MNNSVFEQLINQTVQTLPPLFKEALTNIVIIVEEEPKSQDLVAAKLPPTAILFGLYQGVPLTKRGGSQLLLPDRITIFKGPLERTYATGEALKQQIRSTVLHELGHFLGMSEDELRNIHQS